MNKIILLILGLVLLADLSASTGTGQTLPNFEIDENEAQENFKNYKIDKRILGGDGSDQNNVKSFPDIKSYFLPDMEPPKEQKKVKRFKTTGETLLGAFEDSVEYNNNSKAKLVKQLNSKGRSNFGFSYNLDQFSYSNPNGTIDNILKDDSQAINPGMLEFTRNFLFYNDVVTIGAGMNFGVAYHQGRGTFSDGSRSETLFKFLSIPIDLSLMVEMSFTRWIKLTAKAGPSLMFLYQSRNDFDDDESGKRVYQVSEGYFLEGKVKFALSNIMKRTLVDLYRSFDVTKFYLTFDYRIQNFSSFQDVLSIDGSSVGVGFVYEFL